MIYWNLKDWLELYEALLKLFNFLYNGYGQKYVFTPILNFWPNLDIITIIML
jgi:hypothetical protein